MQNLIDIDSIMPVIILVAIIFGVITALVAKHNERSPAAGFATGFFLGALGLVTYMIMGETAELRAYINERERRNFQAKKE